MTAILWKDGKLLTDSATFNGLEWVDVGNKAVIVRRMVFIQTDPNSPGDPILAYTYTGAKAPAEAMMGLLASHSATVVKNRFDNVPCMTTEEKLRLMLSVATELSLVNDDNNYTLLLIGKKHNYLLSINAERGENFQVLEKTKMIALGTASSHIEHIVDKWSEGCSPIYAMVNGMASDKLSGGRIFQYEVFDSKLGWAGAEVFLTGVYEEPSKIHRAIYSARDASYNPAPDLVFNTTSFQAQQMKKPISTAVCDWKKYVETFKSTTRRKKKA